MFPRDASNYGFNCRATEVVFTRKAMQRTAKFMFLANFNNLRFCELRHITLLTFRRTGKRQGAMFRTARHQPMLGRMAHIFIVRTVFEIARMVVRFNSVLMVDNQTARAHPVERHSDKGMNCEMRRNPVSTKQDIEIPVSVHAGLNQMPCRVRAAFNSLASNATKGRGRVVGFISGNLSPLFALDCWKRFRGFELIGFAVFSLRAFFAPACQSIGLSMVLREVCGGLCDAASGAAFFLYNASSHVVQSPKLNDVVRPVRKFALSFGSLCILPQFIEQNG
jgi:hypothetical protein